MARIIDDKIHAKLGKQVNSLHTLGVLAEKRRSVVCNHPAWCRPRAAAFMIHLPGIQLLRLFEVGMWVYDKNA